MKKTDSFVISKNHPCLPGHFPNQPIVPGVVLLEKVESFVKSQLIDWQIVELVQVKFLVPVLPEKRVTIEIDLSRLSSDSKTLSFILYDEFSGLQLATGKIKLIELNNG